VNESIFFSLQQISISKFGMYIPKFETHIPKFGTYIPKFGMENWWAGNHFFLQGTSKKTGITNYFSLFN